MIGYVMVGTNDMRRAAKFYDTVLGHLGLVQSGGSSNYKGYAPKTSPDKAQFFVTKPYNKKAATAGNGTMISLKARSRRAVDNFHAAALAAGGKDEGKPGFRSAEGTSYYAYIRDLDGNKICAYCPKAR